VKSVGERTEGVVSAIDAIDLTSRTMVERVFPSVAAAVGKDLVLDAVKGELIADGALLNGSSAVVDRFSKETGGMATVFARQGSGFRRISTSVKKEDGSRAIGTLLDPNGAAYAALSEGRSYTGRAVLFGRPYMTHYDVLRDQAQQVVGVLFIGFDVAMFDAAIALTVQSTRFFDTGGLYVVDPRGAPTEAVFDTHPTAKGQKVQTAFPDSSPFFKQLASSQGGAVATRGVLNAGGNDRWAVLRVSKATGLWVIAEVSDAEAMRTAMSALMTFWTLLGAACVALSVGLYWLMRQQVGVPLRELSQAAQVVASGDLTNAHTSERQDEIGRVIRDVEAMRMSFRSLLTNVRQSADSISAASGEIAAGNHDLSGRTEQSSASLQQTASAMEQLTATIGHTSQSAKSASGLATSTLTAAVAGNGLMQQMVTTMSDIDASARQIADITSIIDGIAFQTNLLALNAAVEAARAGEQGRGFAVVAAEVRSLAQRSSLAAKDIKGLINVSATKVAAGAALVDSAGCAMSNIQAEVHRVTDLIAAISHAATEQSDGMSQVNSAVGQLDQSTQQNAALVEESTAATQSLNDQAGRLTRVLEDFKI
jgi:methyl-accepting chemotaxis protein